MMITHLSPAKAIRVILLLTIIPAVTTTAVGSTTRNIVQKNEEQEPRALMATVGLNEMECHESLDTNDGSIVCTFRVMPPTFIDTLSSTTTNPNNLLQDCLFLTTIGNDNGSNYCITTEVYRSTSDAANQANNQQTNAMNPATGQQQDCPTYKPQSGSQCGGWIPTGATARNCMYRDNRCDCNDNGLSEASSIIWICDGDNFVAPIVTIDAELSAAIITPTAPADQEPVIPSHSGTIQIPTPGNGPNCPSTMPSNGSKCNWVTTTKFSAYQCGYLSGDEVPQLPGTFMMVCKCDSTDTFVCAPAADEIYYGVQSSSSF